MSEAVNLAQQHVARGDIQGAATILHDAEQAGDALAARELALWCLSGQLVRRNLATSRAMFRRAAALGDPVSTAIFRAFLAAGVGGPADWPAALALLETASATDPNAARQAQLIAAMPREVAFAAEQLNDAPEIRVFRGIFTPAECRYLIDVAAPALQPSIVIDSRTGEHIPNPVRTSRGASFPLVDENPAIHALNRRLAAASGTDVRAGEPLWVLHYAPGQEYRQHSDALPGVATAEQRVLTFLVYLNDDYDGGETVFPEANVSFRGRAGDGLLFRNASADGTPDPRSVHAGLPVTRGVKHLASRWIRAAPLIL